MRQAGLVFLLGLCASTYGQSVSAESAILIHAASGKVLFEKNAKVSRFPASTTKVMTALLLIERCTPDEVLMAPDSVVTVTGASLHLVPGETMTARNVLWGLMLRSANDACVMVAQHISGSVEKFSELMNQRAKELGCVNTNFHNPNGLNDELHTTCAYDLALITREAMKHEAFRQVVKTQRHEIERSFNMQDRWLKSKNKFLSQDHSADGVKTGWTVPAGKCFIGSATRNGEQLISVVLKSEDWVKDTQSLINWGFNNYQFERVDAPPLAVASAKVVEGEKSSVKVAPKGKLWNIHRKYQMDTNLQPEMPAQTLNAPVLSNQRIGTVRVTDRDGFVQELPVFATESVAKYEPKLMSFSGFSLLGIAAAVGIGTLALRRRSRIRPFDKNWGKY